MKKDYLEFIRTTSNIETTIEKATDLFTELSSTSPSEIYLPQVTSFEITGLYPYKSDHIIKLMQEGKANIVYGGNGAGKTTAINCIEFGLLGSSAPDLELKRTFSKRIINRFDVKVKFNLKDKSYLLHRNITPKSESHHPLLKRISGDLTLDFPAIEGVRDVNMEFQSLSGMSFAEYAQIFDFLSLTVPRRHYLASSIMNSPGTQYRQQLFSKLLGYPIPVQIATFAYKMLNQAKNQIQNIKRRILIIEPLQSLNIPNLTHSKDESEENKSVEEEFYILENKLKELKELKNEWFERINENNQKQIKVKPEVYAELAEKELKLEKLTQLQTESYSCDICDSNYTTVALSRIQEGHCPQCGQFADLASTHQEINEIRERIHQINIYLQKIEKFQQKYQEQTKNIIKEINAIDIEIATIQAKKIKLTKENSVMVPSRTSEVLANLNSDLILAETDELLYQELYVLTKKWLDKVTNEFTNKISLKWAYYQRELFEFTKWILAPDYSIFSDDGQEFKDLSHGEKNLIDMIFRMSVFEVLLELKPELNLLFIIDTPEEGLDEAFHKKFTPLIVDFVQRYADEQFIVLTSCEREFVDDLNPDFFQLENLLEKSSNSRLFQKNQLKLIKFLM